MTMIDTYTIERAKSTDLAALVSQHVKLRRRGSALWGCCPFHAEKTPSFKVEHGRFHCFGCGSDGDAIQWLRATAGMQFRDAVAALNGTDIPSAPQTAVRDPETVKRDAEARVREAQAIWARRTVAGLAKVRRYLSDGRCISQPDNPSVRGIEAFTYQRWMTLPAMVTAIVSGSRELTGVQVTVLDPSQPRKATVAAPRKTYGCLGDGAVRLAASDEVLGLAEGVETALSAMELSGVPTWACLGAARMDQVAIPETVRELHIFGDDDGPGRDAMERTAAKHDDLRVVLRLPPEGYNDWNDYQRARCAL
jgi:DNA primase